MQITVDIKKLLQTQKSEWQLANQNYAALDDVQVREVSIGNVTVKVQFNPARIVSSGAKLDKKTIEARPCFLCEKNRPKEQKKIALGEYAVLINPFPIFPEHFTIPVEDHVPQQIKGRFVDMLDVTTAMQGFTVFYNGPKCGASAPDHFHFQAGVSGFMPIDNELSMLKEKYAQKIDKGEVVVYAVKDGLRNFYILESSDKTALNDSFEKLYGLLNDFSNAAEEPMMNILASYRDDKWEVVVLPRVKQRPSQFFEEGDKHIMVSPASVEMGGVLITPLKKDFEKITKADIEDIYKQVLFAETDFDKLTEQIIKL